MNGNPRVLASPGDRSGAPTVIGAGCVHFFGQGKARGGPSPYRAEHLGNVRLKPYREPPGRSRQVR
jgi:hypothetical protein